MSLRILGIDTALGGLSVSLCHGDAELAGVRAPALNDQAAQLVPAVERVLADARLGYADLDALAVTIGPGGFTGVRIGLSTARALAFAANRPILGFTTLDVMACTATDRSRPHLCALPAGREQVYMQCFAEPSSPYAEPSLASIADLLALLDGSRQLVVTDQPWTAALPENTPRIMHDTSLNARILCRLANMRGLADAEEPLPLYIRPPDAKPQVPLIDHNR